jgi:hypothetical protein
VNLRGGTGVQPGDSDRQAMAIALSASQLEVIEQITLDIFEMVRLAMMDYGLPKARVFAVRSFANLEVHAFGEDIDVLASLQAPGAFSTWEPFVCEDGVRGVCFAFSAAGVQSVVAALLEKLAAGHRPQHHW